MSENRSLIEDFTLHSCSADKRVKWGWMGYLLTERHGVYHTTWYKRVCYCTSLSLVWKTTNDKEVPQQCLPNCCWYCCLWVISQLASHSIARWFNVNKHCCDGTNTFKGDVMWERDVPWASVGSWVVSVCVGGWVWGTRKGDICSANVAHGRKQQCLPRYSYLNPNLYHFIIQSTSDIVFFLFPVRKGVKKHRCGFRFCFPIAKLYYGWH